MGLIAGGIWYVVQSLTQKEAMQTNGLLGKQIFLEALIVFFFVLILAELAARIRAKKLVEGSVNRIYTAVLFGFMARDFQKYAPLAGLSGGRICTLLCFLSGLEQKETPVE